MCLGCPCSKIYCLDCINKTPEATYDRSWPRYVQLAWKCPVCREIVETKIHSTRTICMDRGQERLIYRPEIPSIPHTTFPFGEDPHERIRDGDDDELPELEPGFGRYDEDSSEEEIVGVDSEGEELVLEEVVELIDARENRRMEQMCHASLRALAAIRAQTSLRRNREERRVSLRDDGDGRRGGRDDGRRGGRRSGRGAGGWWT